MARKTTECRFALSGKPGHSRVAKKAKKENCRRVGGPSAIADAAAAATATLTDAAAAAAAGAAPPLSKGAGAAGAAAKAARRPLNGAVAETNAAVSVAAASCPVSAEEARQDSPTLSATISPSPSSVAQPVVCFSPSPTSTCGSCPSSSPSSFSVPCSASLSASSSSAASSSPSASSTFAACSFFAQEKKKGVLYIARLPPQMNRATLRRYFDRFGALGRLHVTPLVDEGVGGRGSASSRARGRRSRHGGGDAAEERQEQQEQRGAGEAQQQRGGGGGQQLKSKNDAASATLYRPKAFAIEFSNGAEAWLEFLSRKDAKRVARLLDGQPVASWAAGMGPGGRGRARKARRQWGGDIWCLKYLRGFTWQQLIEEKVYNRRVREARLNAALSQIKRENAVYVHLVEQQKQIDKMREKRRAKLLLLQDQQPPTSTTAAEAADSQRDEQRAEGQQEKPAAGGSRKVIGKDVVGSPALHTAKMSLLGGNLWGAPSSGVKLAQQQLQQQKTSCSSSCTSSSSCSSNSGRAASASGAAEQGSTQGQRRPPERKDGQRQQVAAAGNKAKRPAGPLQTKQTDADAYADLFDLF